MPGSRAFISAYCLRRLPAPAKVIQQNCGFNRTRHPQPGWGRTARLQSSTTRAGRPVLPRRTMSRHMLAVEPASNLTLSGNNLTIVIVVAAVALIALAGPGGLARVVPSAG